MPASYDVTALAIIKPKKHQRLADPLLQSDVVTRNKSRLVCYKEKTWGYLAKPLVSRKGPEPELPLK